MRNAYCVSGCVYAPRNTHYGTHHIYREWLRFRRPCVTLTFGEPLSLRPGVERREAADLIMRRIAALLPLEYRGVYADAVG